MVDVVARLADEELLVELHRDLCADLRIATAREWLCTNGIGGYASGTVAGAPTRRYHGLLVAALQPPLGRTLLVASSDETAVYDGRSYRLGTNLWASGAVDDAGLASLERFVLDGSIPTWRYAMADALLDKQIWMEYGENTTYVVYRLVRGTAPLTLSVKVLVDHRDYHGATHAGSLVLAVSPLEDGLRVIPNGNDAEAYYLRTAREDATPLGDWYRDYSLPREQERGLDDREDHFCAGTFTLDLHEGEALTLAYSQRRDAALDGDGALARRRSRDNLVIAALPPSAVNARPEFWRRQAALAADQFIVRRAPSMPSSVSSANSPAHATAGSSLPAGDGPSPATTRELSARGATAEASGSAGVSPVHSSKQGTGQRPTTVLDDGDGYTVIAGYHWFGDWGRDTMIALPGLTLATGRPRVAAAILKTFAPYVDGGMLPNRFPDDGAPPEYNTVDAALWYVDAVRAYHAATNDDALVDAVYPALCQIVTHYHDGTRHGIHVDLSDGLLYAGEPGVQLTWMDAKVGDWVVTPRQGKPVEVNALWINALRIVSTFAIERGDDATARQCSEREARALASFSRFWNVERAYLYDVLDGPTGDDDAIRPNALFAVSLGIVDGARARTVVDMATRRLLCSHGLRSLDPDDPAYSGVYTGGVSERDGAYHQGTGWAWLLAPFIQAHRRVYGGAATSATYLDGLKAQLETYGLGSIGEIFDGDAPFTPRGCIAQAWSVAALLYADRLLHSYAPVAVG